MCGIYGNLSPDEFFRLYKLNKSRGSYSSGFLFASEGRYEMRKTVKDTKYFSYPFNEQYCLGHNRAPTTDENGKGLSGCHPFTFGKAIAAHNGIISNTDYLESEYKIKFDIDSQWIPFLYDYFKRGNNNPENALRLALLELDGTYGVWLYDIDEEIIFVSRSDNTIYWNDEKTSFTSISDDVHKNLMPQGAIYKKERDQSFIDINENERLNVRQKYYIF